MAGPRLDEADRALLDQLFDKWSLLVLDLLCDGPRRYSELRRALDPITSKSLTQTLRRLERNGVVDRTVVPAQPITVSYEITTLGRTLETPLRQMLTWTVENRVRVDAARERYERAGW